VTFAPRKQWKRAQEKAEFLREQLRPVLLDDAKAADCVALVSLDHFIRGDHDLMELKDVFGIALAAGEANTLIYVVLPFDKEDKWQ
jgi:hypothetical protein